MEGSIENIEWLARNLNIADNTIQNREQERNGSIHDHLVTLQTSIHTILQAANAITSKAQSFKSLAIDANSSDCLSITEACSLHGGIKKLTKTTCNLQATIDSLNEVTEHSVFASLRSCGWQRGIAAGKILSHFEKRIKAIIRDVLNNASNHDVLWKVAEECYIQATKPSGKLDVDDYFAPLDEACLGWPYDSDFESEEYYDHENRLEVDEDYAAALQEREDSRSDARRKDAQSWPGFWIAVLSNTPSGPTLFYPPAGLHTQSSHLDAVPRFLFRTFDDASSGRNDDGIIASTASILGSRGSSRTDLLTLDRHRATKLLYDHLNKSCFAGDVSDNLMSWTSSLLFAVQYAIWRAKEHRRRLSDIKICAVDTRNFPEGQFVQDLWLIRTYYATAKNVRKEIQSFFDFRLEREDYYNGEYLSQGKLNHAGRSCVTSLGHLLDAGLLRLYPEFGDERGSERWTNRVLQLRQNWAAEQETTDQEIDLAFEVARNCFAELDSSEIASILLTFKNRKHALLDFTSE